MVEMILRVKNKAGIHARPASMIVKEASKFLSNIYIKKKDLPGWMNGKSLLGILALEIFHQDEVIVRCEGIDEKEALKTIANLFEKKFNED